MLPRPVPITHPEAAVGVLLSKRGPFISVQWYDGRVSPSHESGLANLSHLLTDNNDSVWASFS